jgi:hypothetical protein
MDGARYVEVIITYMRGDIVFYKITDKADDLNNEEEYDFPLGCLLHYFMEPKELIVNLDAKYYEIKSRSGRMNVIFNFKGYKTK